VLYEVLSSDSSCPDVVTKSSHPLLLEEVIELAGTPDLTSQALTALMESSLGAKSSTTWSLE
jgi:hypothetical protein